MWHVLQAGNDRFDLPNWHELNQAVVMLLTKAGLPAELNVVAEATWRFVDRRLTLEELLPKRKHLTVLQARCIQKLPGQYTVQPACSGHVEQRMTYLRTKETSVERHLRRVSIFLQHGVVVAWHNRCCVEIVNQVVTPIPAYEMKVLASPVPTWLVCEAEG